MNGQLDRKTLERIELLEQEVRSLKFAKGRLLGVTNKLDRDTIVTSAIHSPDFVSGETGWEINRKGNVEFENGIFRGELHTAVFVKDETHVHNGQLLITDACKLGRPLGTDGKYLFQSTNVAIFDFTETHTGTADNDLTGWLYDEGVDLSTAVARYTIWNETQDTVGEIATVTDADTLALRPSTMEFATGDTYSIGHGDLLEMRLAGTVEYLAVVADAVDGVDINDEAVKKYRVSRDLENMQLAQALDPGAWPVGTAVASTKEPTEGWILLDADNATAAPRLEIRRRNTRLYDGWSTKLRLGNLTGVTSGITGMTPSGYGLYAENVFLKGEIHATNARIYNKLVIGSEVGAGIVMGEDIGGFFVFDTRNRPVFSIDKDTGTIRCGYPPDDPAIIFEDGIVKIQTGALVLSDTHGASIRGLLDNGRLDLFGSGTTSWAAADADAIRILAGWGIASKEGGTQNIKWDADTGKIEIGENAVCSLEKLGVVFDSDAVGIQGIWWKSATASAWANDSVGQLACEPYSAYKAIISQWSISGGPSYETTYVSILADGYNADDAYIHIISGPNDTDHTYKPGLFMRADTVEIQQTYQTIYPYALTVHGHMRADNIDGDVITGELNLSLSRHEIIHADREELGTGAMSIVEDGGEVFLCVNTDTSTDYYKVELTKVIA